MILGVHHVNLAATDFEKTVAFYRDGLGLKVTYTWGDKQKAAMVAIGGGASLEIVSSSIEEPSMHPKFPHLALRVTDTDAVYKAALAAGASPHMEPTDILLAGTLPARIAFVKGPSGELIEFFQE